MARNLLLASPFYNPCGRPETTAQTQWPFSIRPLRFRWLVWTGSRPYFFVWFVHGHLLLFEKECRMNERLAKIWYLDPCVGFVGWSCVLAFYTGTDHPAATKAQACNCQCNQMRQKMHQNTRHIKTSSPKPKKAPRDHPLIIKTSQHHHHTSRRLHRNMPETSPTHPWKIPKPPKNQQNNTETSPKKQRQDRDTTEASPRQDRDNIKTRSRRHGDMTETSP